MIVEWLVREKGKQERRERGEALTAVRDKQDKTILVVKCEDGLVRDIPMSGVVP